MVALHTAAYRPLSAIDEFQHYDSLYRATRLELTREGDLVTQATMAVAACRGIEGSRTPPCGANYRAADFPGAGYNTADIHSPVYYFVTAILTVPLRLFGLGLLEAGRLAGAVWLAAGLIVVWKLAEELGAPPAARLAVCILIGSSLNVVEASSIINPDATALSLGGLVALAALRWERGLWPAWLGPAAAFAAVAAKVHNIVGVGAAALFPLARVAARSLPVRRGLLMGATIAAGGVLAQMAWLSARHFLAVGSVAAAPAIMAEHVDRLHVGNVLVDLGSLFTPVNSPYVPRFLAGKPLLYATLVFQNIVLVAGAVGGFFYLDPRSRLHSVASAVCLAALVGAPVLVVATFLARHSYVPPFPRYGLSLLPLFAAMLAASLRTRASLLAAWAVALASLGVLIYYLVAGLR